MAKTTVRSAQVRNVDLQIEDFKDFGVVDAGGLNITVTAGRIRSDNVVTDKVDQNLLLVDDDTSFVEITSVGVASSNIVGFTAGSIPLAEVLTASGAISSITDKRAWINLGTSVALTAKEIDGNPNVSDVTTIQFTNGRLVDNGGGDVTVDLVDAQTATNTGTISTNKTRINRAEQNIILNMFRLQIQNSLSVQNMIDGFADEYEDETGIDAVSSTNESYDATDDFYEPTISATSSEIKLLLHMDGNDASTTFTDFSNSPHTVTANGDAQIDTAQSKFGGASALFDGTGDFLSMTANSDWNFGTGDFTIDAWVRLTDFADDMTIVSSQDDDNNRWQFRISTGGNFVFQIRSGGTFIVNLQPVAGLTAGGAFKHVAVSRSGNDWRFFVNGIQKGITFVDASGFPAFASTTPLHVGIRTTTNDPMKGHIDELRITKGTALWTSDFTPPTSAGGPTTDNMTLISEGQTAEAQPSTARIVILEEDVDSVTLNTDLKCFASRDDGVTFTQITLVNEGNFDVNRRILAASVDISSQPSGTAMVYKITTLNNKTLKIHATGLLWD